MNISPISFGKKIPISKCQVIDKQEKKLINATLYEYDCKDLFDFYDVSQLDDSWKFKDAIASVMHLQYMQTRIGVRNKDMKFYCIKNNNDETLGLCQTDEKANNIDVKIITTNRNNKYKYVGQVLLAQLAQKITQTGGGTLKIKRPLAEVRDYYEKVCGFRKKDVENSFFGAEYELKGEELHDFKDRVEDRLYSY